MALRKRVSSDPTGADRPALQEQIWEQVWAHSRHLETMRSQYLGFFFTAALAVAAIAAKDLAKDGLTRTDPCSRSRRSCLGWSCLRRSSCWR